MAGLPFQKWEDVKEAIDYVAASGARPYIAEYTPYPIRSSSSSTIDPRDTP
jgi:hypothetical protein